jgi:DNA-binding LacI/PurR family transcriptional regulator
MALPEPPTAISPSDDLAIRLRSAREQGIQVPEDLRSSGSMISTCRRIGLTTVASP